MKEKVLITGITGFLGSHLADYIIEKKFNVELFGIKRWHLSNLKNIKHIINKIKFYDCDITDPIGTREVINKINPNTIFHLASESFVSPSWSHPTRYMNVNYNGTLNILDALKEKKSKAIIHIPGSGEEYGEIYKQELPITPSTVLRPVNPYAVSKVAQDLIGYVYFKSYGINVIRTRAFNHEGPRRDKVFGIPWYAYQIALIENNLQKPLLRVGSIDDKRNFTHIRDMVEAYWLSTRKCEPGELYLIGTELSEGNVYTFRQALEKLISMSTVKNIKYKTVKDFTRPTNVPRLIPKTDKFRKKTNWKAKISFEKILIDTLEYWREKVRQNDHI